MTSQMTTTETAWTLKRYIQERPNPVHGRMEQTLFQTPPLRVRLIEGFSLSQISVLQPPSAQSGLVTLRLIVEWLRGASFKDQSSSPSTASAIVLEDVDLLASEPLSQGSQSLSTPLKGAYQGERMLIRYRVPAADDVYHKIHMVFDTPADCLALVARIQNFMPISAKQSSPSQGSQLSETQHQSQISPSSTPCTPSPSVLRAAQINAKRKAQEDQVTTSAAESATMDCPASSALEATSVQATVGFVQTTAGRGTKRQKAKAAAAALSQQPAIAQSAVSAGVAASPVDQPPSSGSKAAPNKKQPAKRGRPRKQQTAPDVDSSSVPVDLAARAKKEAAALTARAQDEAASVVAQAQDEAAKLVSQAKDEAAVILAQARIDAQAIQVAQAVESQTAHLRGPKMVTELLHKMANSEGQAKDEATGILAEKTNDSITEVLALPEEELVAWVNMVRSHEKVIGKAALWQRADE